MKVNETMAVYSLSCRHTGLMETADLPFFMQIRHTQICQSCQAYQRLFKNEQITVFSDVTPDDWLLGCDIKSLLGSVNTEIKV